jgi:hypothetical protein
VKKLLVTLLALVLAMGMFVPMAIPVAAADPDPVLAARWDFNAITAGTVADLSGNGNTGTVNGATLVSGQSALFGNALSFDGNDFVVVSVENGTLDITSTITIEAWIYPTNVGAGVGAYRCIVAKRYGNFANYALRLDDGGRLDFYYSGPSATGSATDWNVWHTTDRPISANSWYHVAVTFTFAGGPIAAYVNGSSVTGAWYAGGPSDPATANDYALRIGMAYPGYEQYFIGKIDEVRIWRSVLDAYQLNDMTPPTITSSNDGQTYLLNQVVAANGAATDGGTGVASVTTSVANLDTSTVGTHTFTVTATDYAKNQATKTVTYYVDAPPTVGVNNASVTVNEGQQATNTGTWSDPDDVTVTLSASVGTVVQNNGAWSWSFQTTDGPAETQTVTITATDEHGATGTATFNLTVNNMPPVLTITRPTAGTLYAKGDSVNLAASFTDAGTGDTHTASINWDDGTTSSGTVVESNGSGTISASHAYANAGVYTIQVTVTDDDGGSDTEAVMVVVYDPSAGFVTGGGWINSPAGAYAADPSLAGKATFGFVSKYQKGATVPTGQTEFQFQVANFNFHSESYQWLVVAGAKAQYKGTGTVNGAPGYGFLLTATDGQINGGGGVDKFRIKIWLIGGAVVYDNVVAASDDIDVANPQAIGGGSIVIHAK